MTIFDYEAAIKALAEDTLASKDSYDDPSDLIHELVEDSPWINGIYSSGSATLPSIHQRTHS